MSCRRVGSGPRLARKGRSWMAPIGGRRRSLEGRREWTGVRTGWREGRIEARATGQLGPSSLAYLEELNKFYLSNSDSLHSINGLENSR